MFLSFFSTFDTRLMELRVVAFAQPLTRRKNLTFLLKKVKTGFLFSCFDGAESEKKSTRIGAQLAFMFVFLGNEIREGSLN